MSLRLIIGLILGLSLFAAACGLKGPPLPPVPDTAEQSDREERAIPAPSPAPSVNPGVSGIIR